MCTVRSLLECLEKKKNAPAMASSMAESRSESKAIVIRNTRTPSTRATLLFTSAKRILACLKPIRMPSRSNPESSPTAKSVARRKTKPDLCTHTQTCMHTYIHTYIHTKVRYSRMDRQTRRRRKRRRRRRRTIYILLDGEAERDDHIGGLASHA